MQKLLTTILFSLILTTFFSQKKIKPDSIKEFTYSEIHYSKGNQGLYDKKNKTYILPFGNFNIERLREEFYGKTSLIKDSIIYFLELSNNQIIIKNSIAPHGILVPVLDIYGKNVDQDLDGVEDYQETMAQGHYNSGVYDIKAKKWILEPKFYKIECYDSLYLVDVYTEHGQLKKYIYSIKGDLIAPIFQDRKNELKKDLAILFKADSISQLDDYLFAIHSKKNLKIVFFEHYWDLFILSENNYSLFEYEQFENSTETKTFISKKNNDFYFNYFNLKTKEETIEIINHDNYIKKNSKSYYPNQFYEATFSSSDSINIGSNLLDDINSQENIVLFGKIKLSDQLIVIVNTKNCYSSLIPIFDSNGNNVDYDNNGIEDYEHILIKGKYKSGLFNNYSNEWIFLPKYEKIISTKSGFTTVSRTDSLINDYIISHRTYSFYDNDYKFLGQKSDINYSLYQNTDNFSNLYYNVEFYTQLFEANKLFEAKDYEKALILYKEAGSINPKNTFIQQQILELEKILETKKE